MNRRALLKAAILGPLVATVPVRAEGPTLQDLKAMVRELQRNHVPPMADGNYLVQLPGDREALIDGGDLT